MTLGEVIAPGEPCTARVWLVDGSHFDVESYFMDDLDAVCLAGSMAGQDVAHLVKEVEWR